MEPLNQSTPTVELGRNSSFPELLEKLQSICNSCNPMTPTTCLTDCKIWRVKNQFRKIHDKVNKANYEEYLLNALKNHRRLELLFMVSKKNCSGPELQQKFRSLGFSHSLQTIVEEYVRPLVDTGLLQDGPNPYRTTIFGSRVNDLMENFRDLEKLLSPHSECHEEKVIETLAGGPKTYSEIGKEIPEKSVSRVLSRLCKAGLTERSKDNSYVFFFKSKRNVRLESISQTEEQIYYSIPDEGISAGKLSEMAKNSLRKTYKYLRKLKGKKLIFVRKRPLAYSLTSKGNQVACMLKQLHNLVMEARVASEQLLAEKKNEQSAAKQP